MKLRSVLLLSAALLVAGSLAMPSLAVASDPAPAEPVALPEADAALSTPVDAEAECAGEDLDLFASAPTEQAAGPCGQCSQQNCRGGQIGQGCGFSGGRWYTCQYPFAETCSTGGPKCYCWTGMLP